MDFCRYHPEKEAIGKCTDCQRLICMADSHVVTQWKDTFVGTKKGDLYTSTANQVMYCTPCNVDRLSNAFAELEKAKTGPVFKLSKWSLRLLILLLILRYGGSLLLYQSLLVPKEDLIRSGDRNDAIQFLIFSSLNGLLTIFIIATLMFGFIAWFLGLNINNQLKNKDPEIEKAMRIKDEFEKKFT